MGKHENPRAFPSEQHETLDGSWNQTFDPGMTFRDYIATHALTGIIATCSGDTDARKMGHDAYFAKRAYGLADAMLAARALPNPDTDPNENGED